MKKTEIFNQILKKKIFFFDFDGVIVNSNNIKAFNFYKIFDIQNTDLKKKIINFHNNNIGMSRYEKIQYFIDNFEELSNFQNRRNSLIKKFKDLCINDISKCDEISGAFKFLKKIKNNKSNIILCSATPLFELKQILKKRKLNKIFDHIYGYPKIKSQIISNFIIKKKGKYHLGDYIYFGDSNSDYQAAKNNNIDFVRVKSNKNFNYSNKKIMAINDFNF